MVRETEGVLVERLLMDGPWLSVFVTVTETERVAELPAASYAVTVRVSVVVPKL